MLCFLCLSETKSCKKQTMKISLPHVDIMFASAAISREIRVGNIGAMFA